MGSRLLPYSIRALERLPTRAASSRQVPSPRVSCQARLYSSETPQSPPLLSKIKGDLKAAMRAKDQARLTVLRSIISATNNAAKTSSPIKTDVQLVALLRKTARASQDAAGEFRDAGRQDLVEKEEAQVRILEEYSAESGVESLGEVELKAIIQNVMTEIAAESLDKTKQSGEVMKRLMAKGGPLDGKDVDRAAVSKLVKEATS